MDGPQKSLVQIIDYVLSPTDPKIIWVACSSGSLYRVDWTSGEGLEKSWKTSSKGTIHMTVASMDLAGEKRDVVFTTEKHDNGWRISAHELSFLGSSTATQSRVVYTSTQMIQILKAVDEGAIIVAASGPLTLARSTRSGTNFGSSSLPISCLL
jgi:NET1-associated nuclear protein 1 (U3 small nucleolar RNA-associated protein 17)